MFFETLGAWLVVLLCCCSIVWFGYVEIRNEREIRQNAKRLKRWKQKKPSVMGRADRRLDWLRMRIAEQKLYRWLFLLIIACAAFVLYVHLQEILHGGTS